VEKTEIKTDRTLLADEDISGTVLPLAGQRRVKIIPKVM